MEKEAQRQLKNHETDEQMDLFFKDKPELKEKFERVKYKISILGGDKPEKQASFLGYELTKKWFSIITGGYNKGVMKAALEGADKALEEMVGDENNSEALSLLKPAVVGITAERFAPIERATKGDNIKTEVAEGNYDLYLRLGKLMEDSEISVVLPGETGTELEVMANLHFDKKLKSTFNIPTKPIVFVGDTFDELLEEKFKNIINEKGNVYKANNENEAIELIEDLFTEQHLLKEEDRKEDLEIVREKIHNRQLKFN